MPPKTIRIIAIIIALTLIYFIFLEVNDKWCSDTITENTKHLLNRFGVVSGSFSAFIAGCFIYWDTQAEIGTKQSNDEIKSTAENLDLLKRIQPEAGNDYGSIISQKMTIIEAKEQEIDDYKKYFHQKRTIQHMCSILLLASIICFLFGSIESEKIIAGKPHTCDGKVKSAMYSLRNIQINHG
ncbi:hypothetical protein ABEW79_11265 [Delftia tsuruhatensis]|uniref:hypothetical protein n=1 Tax=Delftia tsuruhatensis TaxID=180282 RepID=UPI003D23D55F